MSILFLNLDNLFINHYFVQIHPQKIINFLLFIQHLFNIKFNFNFLKNLCILVYFKFFHQIKILIIIQKINFEIQIYQKLNNFLIFKHLYFLNMFFYVKFEISIQENTLIFLLFNHLYSFNQSTILLIWSQKISFSIYDYFFDFLFNY